MHTGPGLSEQNLQKIDGELRYRAPVDPKPVTFSAAETGKPKEVHDSSVALSAVTGNAARLRFRGATENMLLVKGYAADGAALLTLAGIAAGLATVVVFVGFFILGVTPMWFLYRGIKGWIELSEGKPMYGS